MRRAFLFGAGAEVDFKLSGGEDFAKKILLAKEPDMVEINKAIKKYYKEKKGKNERKRQILRLNLNPILRYNLKKSKKTYNFFKDDTTYGSINF